jgi:hypothetical protein
MDRQEYQSNWPKMRKTLGKPVFFSGEDRIRTNDLMIVDGLIEEAINN